MQILYKSRCIPVQIQYKSRCMPVHIQYRGIDVYLCTCVYLLVMVEVYTCAHPV